jgi:hypothetical protein
MTTPVYIQAGYAFRPGSRIKAELDATAIGNEIATLRDEQGIVKVDAVVDAARPTQSAMHLHFTWDDDIAAENWRRDEGRYLLRSILPVYADAQTEEEYVAPRRAYVAVYSETNDSDRAGEYQMLTVRTDVPRARPAIVKTEAPATEDDTQAVLLAPPPAQLLTPERERALGTLKRWADAYGDDPYFAGVVAAIRALGR